MPTVTPGVRGRGEFTLIQAWMALRGQRPPGWQPLGWPLERPYWDVDPADLEDAVAELAGWALSLPGRNPKAAVATELYSIAVPLAAATQMLSRATRLRSRPLRNELIVTAGGRTRWVDVLHWSGDVMAGAGAAPGYELDWATALAEVRDLLATAGTWCAYGHLTRTRFISRYPDNGDRDIGAPWNSRWSAWRQLVADGTLWDAYGVMRLPHALATALDLEPLWLLTDLPSGDVLAEHVDLPAWYSSPQINAEVIAAARAALGEGVIDRSSELLRP